MTLDRRGEMNTLLQAVRAEVREGDVTGASGGRLSWYCDVRRVLLSPLLYKACIAVFQRLHGLDYDCVITCGVGGTALLGGLQGFLLADKRGAVLRDSAKAHGLQRSVEGDLMAGDRVVLLDDVLTTGGSLARMAIAAREAGAEPVCAVVVLDRGEGAAPAGLLLRSVFSAAEVR